MCGGYSGEQKEEGWVKKKAYLFLNYLEQENF
jgi:hypothetical protein